MATRKVVARFGFNGIDKGHEFDYDPETDTGIAGYIEAGFLAHVDDDEQYAQGVPYAESSVEDGAAPLGFGFTGDGEMTAKPIANSRRTRTKAK